MGFIYVPMQRCPESRSLAQMQITLVNKQRGSWDRKEENEYKSDDSMSPRSFGFVWF